MLNPGPVGTPEHLEHLPGKAYRVVPIFAGLRSHLAEAFELAAEGAEYVVPGDHRKAACPSS